MSEQLVSVTLYGRLRGLTRARIAENLVKIGARLARGPAQALTVVLAHEKAGDCLSDGLGLHLPFRPAEGARLLSEGAFRRALGLADRPRAPAGPYAATDLARLTGLPLATVEALVLFDPALADGIRRRRKRSGHLLSKGRYLAAQLLAILCIAVQSARRHSLQGRQAS